MNFRRVPMWLYEGVNLALSNPQKAKIDQQPKNRNQCRFRQRDVSQKNLKTLAANTSAVVWSDSNAPILAS